MENHLPKWLQRSPAQIEAEAETQAFRRASHSRAHLTETERLVGQGALLEQTARQNLVSLIEAGFDTTEERERLAAALAMQGFFAEAANAHPDTGMRRHFLAIQSAIDLDDAERCNCDDFTGESNGVEVSITPRYDAQHVFSRRHNKVVSLITCAKCGHVNAREPRSRLLTQQTAQAQNRVTATSGRGMISDAQILNATP